MGRAVGGGDPAWTEEDTGLALEWQEWAAGECPGCGHHLTESMDEANAYEPHDRVCFACEAKESRIKQISDAENPVTAGRKIGVTLLGRNED